MDGGNIVGNKQSVGAGGGVCVYDSGTFTMNGGNIIANRAASGAGGGVYVYTNATFAMNGGSITDNYANFNGGVYVGGTFKVSGNPVIESNVWNNEIRNVALTGDKTITVTGALTDGAHIGVFRPSDSGGDDNVGVFTSGYSANNTVGETVTPPSSYFFSDSGWSVVLNNGEAKTAEYVPLTAKPTITVSNDHNPPIVGDTLTASTTASNVVYEW